MPGHSSLQGALVAHYRVLEEIGVGGMGIVYKAEDTNLRRPAALNFSSGSFSGLIPPQLSVFVVRPAASALNHPNICTIYQIEKHEGREFIAMEYLDGMTLKSRIGNRPMDTESVLPLCHSCRVLDAAHAQPDWLCRATIRDIKPANIFVTKRGHAKILDFGVAKLSSGFKADADADTSAPTIDTSSEHLTSPGAAVGTIAHVSGAGSRQRTRRTHRTFFSIGRTFCMR